MDISLKRIIGYILDIILVTLVATLISQIKVINPYMEKYQEAYEKYEDLTKEEIEANDERIIDINYDLYKYRSVNSAISLVCLLLYFGIFEFACNGQTLGQKAMKIKIVQKNTMKRAGIINYGLRIVILNNIVFTIIAMILVFVLTPKPFYYAAYVISLIQNGILLLNIVMVIMRKDRRGLHDMLSNTIVVGVDEKLEEDELVDEPKKISIKEKAEKKGKVR